MDLATVGLRPDETTAFEPPSEQPESVLCCPKNLYQVAAAPSENKNVAAQRVLLKRRLHLRAKPLKPASHIGDARRQPDACACRKADHDRRLPNTVRNVSASTTPSTLTTERPI
jgi:hypothetical protein